MNDLLSVFIVTESSLNVKLSGQGNPTIPHLRPARIRSVPG